MSYSFRIKGSVEEVATDLLWQQGCTGIVEEDTSFIAYFNEKLELPFEGEWQEPDTTDYVEAYYASLDPVFLKRLVIAPTHSEVSINAGQRVLWLDPGMAFGTGHHETTRLILSSLEKIDLQGKTVLDVGAGSGILAIAADLLGAKSALGVDIDPLTILVAKENASLNKSRASFSEGTLEVVKVKADVLLANLFAELHIQLAKDYKEKLEPGGYLLLSGIMREKADSVVKALEPFFSIEALQHEGEWSFVQAKPW